MSFDPVKLGNLEIKNHFVRSATSERKASEEGHLTSELVSIYEELAKKQIGLIITGYTYPSLGAIVKSRMMGIYDDSFIEEYQAFTKMIHTNGSKVLMQLVHGGSSSNYRKESRRIVGPSPLKHIKSEIIPEELSKADIECIVDDFVLGAVRAQKSGFDGIQIHAAHTYLICEFLDPRMNQRDDEYGGEIHQRAKILYDIYEKTRKAVGNDFHLSVKIHCSDFNENGMSFEESLAVCQRLDELGIDSIELSGGDYGTRKGSSFYAQEASQIADGVSCAIMFVGGNSDLVKCEEILATSKIKAVSLCRPLICEPDFVLKFMHGKQTKSKCVRCGQCFSKKHCTFHPLSRTALFASDFDGTFSKDGMIITEENIEAAKKWSINNYFGLISGRESISLKHLMDKYGVAYDFLACYNGGLILDAHGRKIVDFPLTIDLDMILTLMRNHHVYHLSIIADKVIYHEYLSVDKHLDEIKKFNEATYHAYKHVSCVDEMKQQSVYQVCCECVSSEEATRLCKEINELNLGCNAFVNTSFVDVVSSFASKENGVRALQKAFGVDKKDVYVIGDSFNDDEMIKEFHGFCMSDAHEDIKQHARKIYESVSDCLNECLK